MATSSGSFSTPSDLFGTGYTGVQDNTQLEFDQRSPSPFQPVGMNLGQPYGSGPPMGYNAAGRGRVTGQAYQAGRGTYSGGYSYQGTGVPQIPPPGSGLQPRPIPPLARESSSFGQSHNRPATHQAPPAQYLGCAFGYSGGPGRPRTSGRGQPIPHGPASRQQHPSRASPAQPGTGLPPPDAPGGLAASSFDTSRFKDDDFPSLSSTKLSSRRGKGPSLQSQYESSQPTEESGASNIEDPSAATRGGRRKFVPFTDFSTAATSQEHTLPPPRRRRNPAFRININDCYRGKVIYIDKLEGIDYSDHPAVVRNVNKATQTLTFFKQSSFKKIGGFDRKYGMYTSQNQKKWHEKQWVLVHDGSTETHHGTPVMFLANGERMAEMGSYLDVHGDTELHIDYFSKYSRNMQFPELFFPADEMEKLETYSGWYLRQDEQIREQGERKRRDKPQTDGADDGEDEPCPIFNWEEERKMVHNRAQ